MKRRLALFALGLMAGNAAWWILAREAVPPMEKTDIIIRRPAIAIPREPEGIGLRLGEAAAERESGESIPQADAQRLGDEETAALLSRLPALELPAEAEQEFAFPPQPLPPPKPGQTIVESFPPAVAPQPPELVLGKAPRVVQHAPEGNVQLAAQVSVTFSEPMVPLTTVEALDAASVPLEITPSVEGKWRWLGTKTLTFAPEPRFAMATRYTARLRDGAKSAAGVALAEGLEWNFATPAPKLTAAYPTHGPQRREPLMFAAFDQKIDPQAVLAVTRIELSDSSAQAKLRLATPEEVAADPTVSALAKQAQPGRWLAFRAVEPLPLSVVVRVLLGPGLPSAEGPLKSDALQEFQYSIYGPFKIVNHGCYDGENCRPGSPWYIEFSNPLDEAKLDGVIGQVAPGVTNLKAEVQGNRLVLFPINRGRMQYRATLHATIADVFGQILGEDQTVEFNTGSADPMLWSNGGEMIVLDPAGPRRLSVYSRNYAQLKVQIFRVTPDDYAVYMRTLREPWQQPRRLRGRTKGGLIPATPPGKRVVDRVIDVAGRPDDLVETAIDLSPAMEKGLGQVIVLVEPVAAAVEGQMLPRVQTWVQSTQLTIDAFHDASDMLAWVTRLSDGKPVAGAEVALVPSGKKAVTGVDGLARWKLDAQADTPTSAMIASLGTDVALLPQPGARWSNGDVWATRPLDGDLRWHVFDDRQMYRPGEEVHVKGWLRRVTAGPRGDVEALAGAGTQVSYTLNDSQGNELAKGTTTVGPAGGFDLALTVPSQVNLGPAALALTADGVGERLGTRQHLHSFQIQEFRRPEYEVKSAVAQGPFVLGDTADVTVTASYFAGGPLPAAQVDWNVNASPGSFTPPGNDDFVFGSWVPWWGFFDRGRGGNQAFGQLAARTDSRGEHRLRVEVTSILPPRATSVVATANVTDVNRQQWSTSSTLLVHPSRHYVGLRPKQTFVDEAQPLVVEAVVCDLDGKRLAERPIEVELVRLDWTFVDGQWQELPDERQEQKLQSAAEPIAIEFQPKLGGSYRLRARVRDEQERLNESEIRLWVSGGPSPPARDVTQQEVELIPSAKEFQAGQVAEVLIRAPFAPAEGLVLVNRSGMLQQERISLTQATHTLRVPIEEGFVPNVYVAVHLVGSAPRADDRGKPVEGVPPRPAFASGSVNLSVPPRARTLAVEVAPSAQYTAPGSTVELAVTVRDAAGNPARGAEVAVVVVDEAVLALSNYEMQDPLAIFYAQRSDDVSDYKLRHSLVLGSTDDLLQAQNGAPGRGGGFGGAANEAAPEAMAMPAAAPMERSMMFGARMMKADGAASASAPPPVALRTNFNPLAGFFPALNCDDRGRASVTFKLPDNLTRYRVMAVAVSGGRQFGHGQGAITARLPLLVRPSPPRFLNFGDRFELPLVVQNQTDAAVEVSIGVRAGNAELTDGAGRTMTIPARDRREVRLPAAAARAGKAHFQIIAATADASDAAQAVLPVYTPATAEAFATYGEIDSGAIAQPVVIPSDVIPQFGHFEVSTSSTALSALSDAVLYLMAYPYECAEQISSRVLAIAALRDVMTAFAAPGLPAAPEIESRMADDLRRLATMQNDDGGFGFWFRGQQSWPYLSVHVTQAMLRAKAKDYAVPDAMLQPALGYVGQIEQHIPSDYPVECRRAIMAYALRTRRLAGQNVAAEAQALFKQAPLDAWPLEPLGWLLSALANDPGAAVDQKAILRHLANRAVETAGAAHFATSYSDGAYLLLHSDRRTDAVLLEALLAVEPDGPLVVKLVRGLLGHRTKGRWTNTQENCFVLLALDRYFQQFEKVSPDFVARIWLGSRLAGQQEFHGHEAATHELRVPLPLIGTPGQTTALVMSKDGPGRLYYRLGLRYAPRELNLGPADYGFTVERRYEAIDQPDDVRRDADGNWHVRSGARVRVVVSMLAPTRRYHVALVDPLPAGLEAVNPALAVSATPSPGPTPLTRFRGGYWEWPWYEHQNLRDDRVEAFSSLVWEGVHEYRYEARATTPGVFVVPPARAEEMYGPETFGRSASARMTIE